MTTSGQGGVPGGWYDDPTNPQQQRYFDGAQWTEHVRGEPVEPDYATAGPGYATPVAASGRSWLLPALLTVLALAGGFAAGYLVAQGDEPDATVTTSRTTSPSSPTPKQTSAQAALTMNDLKSFLRRASLAQEVHYTDFDTYTASVADLQKAELIVPAGISFRVIRATKTEYCMSAQSPSVPGQVWFISTPPGGGSTATSLPKPTEPTLRPCS